MCLEVGVSRLRTDNHGFANCQQHSLYPVVTSFVLLHFKFFGLHFCGCDTGKALRVKRGKPLAFKRKLSWDYSHALEALVKQSLISKLHHEVPGLRYLNFQTAQAVGRMKLNFGIVC